MWRRAAGFVLAVLLLWTPSRAQAQQDGEAPPRQQVQLSLRYGPLQDAYVESFYQEGTFYLSLSDIFEHLQLDYEVAPRDSTVSGFYISEDRNYEIDFEAGQAFVGNASHSFSSEAFILTELDAFLKPALYEKLFGWELSVDLRALTATLEAPEDLPIDRSRERARARRSMERLDVRRDPAPLLSGRNRRWLAGGVLDYSLGATTSERGSSVSYNLRGGGEVLGGDLEGRLRGIVATDQGTSVEGGDLRWRFVPAPNPYVSQLRVGALTSSGLQPFSYYGVHFSNEPVRTRRLFGTYEVQGQTAPENEVELYVNDQLVAYDEANELGQYRFEIPVTYGTTLVTVRTYGPSGAYQERRRRLQVPFAFVPQGQVYYNVDAGRTEPLYDTGLAAQPSPQRHEDTYSLTQASAAVGITSWLTNKAGLEYVGNVDARPARHPLRFYNTLSARWQSYIASVRVAPSVSYRAALNAYYPSLASFQVSYERFADAPLYQFADRENELRLQASLPFEYGSVPIYARLDGRRQGLTSGEVSYRLFPSVTAQLTSGLRGTLEYRAAARRFVVALEAPGPLEQTPVRLGTSELQTRWAYSVPRPGSASSWLPGWLQGTLLSAEVSYDTEQGQLGRLGLNVSQRVMNRSRLRFSITHDPASDYTSAQARLTMRLPYARSTTSTHLSGQSRSVTQAVSGAVGYDQKRGDLVFDDRSWVGQAAASVRMFLDYNGNDTFNAGERVIKEGDVRFERATATRTTEAGVMRASNLLAYNRYNMYIDESTIKNPLWTPKVDTFSVVAAPNRFKPVDIPFYVGGVVQGSVLKATGDTQTPVSGLKVHLRSADGSYDEMLPVFSDGSFYKMGVPPGEYTARVDSSQLDVLTARSKPAVHRFEVEATKQGDFVEGLDFVLHPRRKE